jgi:hypothetical protein
VDFELVHHLTADVFVVKSSPGDNAVEGTLHVKFEPDARAPFEVAVIAYNGTNVVDETSVVVSQTQGAIAMADIDEVTEVAVITVDPNWNDTGRGTSRCEVWVAGESPCGDLPEPILEIDNVEALQAALESPPASGTIRLAPGTYYPPTKTWEDYYPKPPFDPIQWANLMLDGVTLAGSGTEMTTIITPMIDAVPVFVRGNATIRDLTIAGYEGPVGNVFYVKNVGDFRMCNVVINCYHSESAVCRAMLYENWLPGSHDISIQSCTVQNMSELLDYEGIGIHAFRYDHPTAPTVNLDLMKTEFYNWRYGVLLEPSNDGTIVVDTDCYYFSNVTHHVYDEVNSVEHCP